MQDVELFVEEVLHRSQHSCSSAVRDEAEDIARAATVGHSIGVNIGDAFIYQTKMYLVGFHVDLNHEISLGILDVIEVEVAMCEVAVYYHEPNHREGQLDR
jgi:precorrin-2 methylase